jgi:hypothetical protein
MKLTEEQLDALALSAFPDNFDSRGIYRAGLKQMNDYFGEFDPFSFKEWPAKLSTLCFNKFNSLKTLKYSSIPSYHEYVGYELVDQFTVKINFRTHYSRYRDMITVTNGSINFNLQSLLYETTN